MVSFFSKLLTALTHRLVEHRAAGRFNVPYLSDIFFWGPGRKNFQTVLLIGGVQCVLHCLYFFLGETRFQNLSYIIAWWRAMRVCEILLLKNAHRRCATQDPCTVSLTYVRTYVHVGNYACTYVGTYVAGCVSNAVLSRCKRNRIYVGMYYVCTYVKCFLRMDVFPFSAKQEQRNPT